MPREKKTKVREMFPETSGRRCGQTTCLHSLRWAKDKTVAWDQASAAHPSIVSLVLTCRWCFCSPFFAAPRANQNAIHAVLQEHELQQLYGDTWGPVRVHGRCDDAVSVASGLPL